MPDSTIPPYRPGWFIPLYDPVKNRLGYYAKNGTWHIVGAPPVPPHDGNSYPLKMPAGVEPGAPVTIGVGPDQIQLQISGNPASAADGNPVFDVLLDGKLIADDLVCTDFSGEAHGQYFTIHGTWGDRPKHVTLSPALTKPGLTGAWITAVQYNSLPCQYSGRSPNSRPEADYVNRTSVWDTTGMLLTFSTEFVPEQPPVPVPDLTVISGATIDGKPAAPGTLAALIEQTPAGGTLQDIPGRIVGTSAMGMMMLAGAGMGKTTIDATGLAVAFGKAVLVPTVSGAVIEDMTITGAAGPDNNAAAVRQQGIGIDFTLNRVEVFGCQDGILTFAGKIVLDACNFHDNGAADGSSHEIYCGGSDKVANRAGSLSATNSSFTCGTKSTHAVKCRLGSTTIAGCTLTGSYAGSGAVDGSVLDIPDGGAALITDTTIAQGKGTTQRELIGYAMESDSNGVGTVELQRVHLVITEEAGYVKAGRPGAKLIIGAGCTYTGPAPTLVGWDAVEGAFTPAAA